MVIMLSIVQGISVRRQVSGKASAAGIAANRVDQEPAASALPLTYFSNDAHFTGNANSVTLQGATVTLSEICTVASSIFSRSGSAGSL